MTARDGWREVPNEIRDELVRARDAFAGQRDVLENGGTIFVPLNGEDVGKVERRYRSRFSDHFKVSTRRFEMDGQEGIVVWKKIEEVAA